MKIIDVMKHSADLLGLTQEKELLNSVTEENQADILKNEEINRMLNLSALSIQELCSNYISVYEEVEIEVENNIYPTNKLKNFIRIMNVYKDGESVPYKTNNRNIFLQENGKFTVRYCTYPDITSMMDDIDFLNEFSPDVIVMGLCAYYSIAHGMFKEFDIFHGQYLDKANAIKDLKLFELPLRRWE